MSTKPHHDTASLALDARRVHDASITSLADKMFAKRVSRPELSELLVDIEQLEQISGQRPDALVAKVAAGVHAARARAALISFASNMREDAHIEFADDVAMQRAFGVGVHASAGSTREVKSLAEAFLAAAAKHPKQAAKVGLDAHGIREQKFRAEERERLILLEEAGGLSRTKAEDKVAAFMKTQAALHDPDQIAGGDPTRIKKLGSKYINSSIGSQWKDKVQVIDDEVAKVAAKRRPKLIDHAHRAWV